MYNMCMTIVRVGIGSTDQGLYIGLSMEQLYSLQQST